MLSVEKAEKSVLRGGTYNFELLKDNQKEAISRRNEKEITERVMSKEVAKLLQDQMRDRRMQMEIER